MVGEADDGNAAVDLALSLQPDIVLMDVHMPYCNGVEATAQILRVSPQIGILMLTMLDDDESLWTAMRVGARGYVLKGADRVELARALKAVGNGEAIFSPTIAQRLTTLFAHTSRTTAAAFPELSEREREVLALIGQGLSNSEIANRLHISGKTVRNHVTNIFGKLEIAERSEAIARAREGGLV